MTEDRSRTRHRSSRLTAPAPSGPSQDAPRSSVPVGAEEEVVRRDECCKPYLLATFRNGDLVRLERRHVGRSCAGIRALVDIRVWRKRNGLRP